MGNIVSLYFILLAIYIPSTLSENTEKQTSKEWIFQFDLNNNKNWDDYSVVQDDETSPSKLVGSSNGCTQRIPVIFKQLCVNWNDNNGFSLKFKSSNNINIDPNYDDLLWYYGDHNTAKNAEKVAKAKYVDLEDKSLTEISHNRRRLVKKIGTKKCYWYSDAKACAHVDASNKNLMTVSVGVNEDYDDAAAEYSDFADYYDNDDDDEDEYYDEDEYEYEGDEDYTDYDDDDDDNDGAYNYEYEDDDYDDDDYEEYDLDDIYEEYMQQMQLYNQQQQELYNQQWANYLQNLNNLYWQNMFQQQQQQQVAAAATNGYLYGDYYDVDSDEKAAGTGDEGEGEGEGEGAQFGISESDIMSKAEAEARKHVEAKMEKKLEGRLEQQMMKKMNTGFGGEIRKKSQHHYGEEMDEEHMGEPQEEGEIEQDQNERAPQDSLSQESH